MYKPDESHDVSQETGCHIKSEHVAILAQVDIGHLGNDTPLNDPLKDEHYKIEQFGTEVEDDTKHKCMDVKSGENVAQNSALHTSVVQAVV